MSPAATICKALCAAPGPLFSGTTAIPSRSAFPSVTPYSLGALIALYERAVGFYGVLVNINAYHQPGVEAGKKAATRLLDLQKQVREKLGAPNAGPFTAESLAQEIGADAEDVYHILVHLAANLPALTLSAGATPAATTFQMR